MTTQSVRLGKSGLKVSRLILGCMSYGTPEWQPWVLGEEEGIAQIKFAYVHHTFRVPKRAYFVQVPCLIY
jgi:aryl-alcohol dehydrogenase-like predicted oxidoreductase